MNKRRYYKKKYKREDYRTALRFKNLLSIMCDAVISVILILLCTMLLLQLCGLKFYIVMSGSMEPAIHTGSMCVVNTQKKYQDIVEGEVIAFYNMQKVAVTHRAIRITDRGIETKGDNNQVSDGITVTEDNYIGETVFHIPKIGYLLYFVQKKSWKMFVGVFILSCLWIRIFFLCTDQDKYTGKTFR